MELRTYYRMSLLLMPVLLALSFFVPLLNPLFWVAAYAGPQYIVFSVLAFVMIGKIRNDQLLKVILYIAPLLFVPIEFLGIALIGTGDPHIPFEAAETLWDITKLVILMGYPVILFVDLTRLFAQSVGVIKLS